MPIQRITLNIIAAQVTIDDRHYAAVYLGDDQLGNNHFKIYLNGQGVGLIVWNRRGNRFQELQWTVHARNKLLSESFIWPNELQKKMLRKLRGKPLFRLIKAR